MEHTLCFEGGRGSRVIIERHGRQRLAEVWRANWKEAVVIGDSQVVDLYGAEAAALLQPCVSRVLVLDFPPGEDHKTRATKERLEDRLLSEGFGRQTCVVGLGGGLSLDLAGFVAATFMRGVPWINLPTTLLAQIDAAVGGKTGLNTGQGKNLIGAFHQPAAIIIDRDYLATLPASQWQCGLGELVKHAMIADADLFSLLESRASQLTNFTGIDDEILVRAVRIKMKVVQEDEAEQGRRAILNFGHTIGHAIEQAGNYALGHGQAVGLGMLVEGAAAVQLGMLPVADLARLRQLLVALNLPRQLPSLTFAELTPLIKIDKKNFAGQVRLALPTRIGAMSQENGVWTIPVTLDLLRRCWEQF